MTLAVGVGVRVKTRIATKKIWQHPAKKTQLSYDTVDLALKKNLEKFSKQYLKMSAIWNYLCIVYGF